MANYISQSDIDPKTGKKFKSWEEQWKYTQEGLKAGTIIPVERGGTSTRPTAELDRANFWKEHYRWYYSEGPAKREGYNEAVNKAWSLYGETGETPWGIEPTTEPTPEITPGVTPEGNEMVPYKPEVTIPTFGEGAAAGIPTPTVKPAPSYEILPEQQEMMDLLSTTITDWVTSGGYGLPPEIQAQMIQQQTDTLKAREQEAIRVMKNNMERRGITNSGYVQANMNMITSGTSVAIAGAIADVQIKSALMKMASFEKAIGAAAQFLGYLSEQSQLAYAPEFATWQAEQLTKMQVWQGKLDVYKMELNQAYQQQNMTLQAQLTSQLNIQQHQYDLELAEMEIEANQKTAMAQGIGGIFGTILGFLFGK